MGSRYVVRRQDDGKYCIWDTTTDAAVSANEPSLYENLGFNEAIDAAIELNTPGSTADGDPDDKHTA
jgi:hypothetical protein